MSIQSSAADSAWWLCRLLTTSWRSKLVQPTRLGGSAASRKKSRKSGVPARSLQGFFPGRSTRQVQRRLCRRSVSKSGNIACMPCRRLPRLGRTNELIVALDMNDISGLALLADRLLEPVHCGGGKGRRRTPRLPHPAIRMVPVANHGMGRRKPRLPHPAIRMVPVANRGMVVEARV